MVAIAKFFVFAAVATASLVTRDATQILNDLKGINTKVNTLTQKANAYNGGVSNALPIQNAATDLDKTIKTATDNAKKSNVVTAPNAQKVIDYINKTLEPNVLKAVNAVIAKKAKFQTDGLKPVVLQTFQTLQKDTNAYATVLVNKSPAAKKQAANAAKAKVNADLQKGVNAFK